MIFSVEDFRCAPCHTLLFNYVCVLWVIYSTNWRGLFCFLINSGTVRTILTRFIDATTIIDLSLMKVRPLGELTVAKCSEMRLNYSCQPVFKKYKPHRSRSIRFSAIESLLLLTVTKLSSVINEIHMSSY